MEPTTFAGAGLDRAAERRGDPTWVAERQAQPPRRAVAVTRDGVVVEPGDPSRLARVRLEGAAGPGPVLLGVEERGALFAVAVDDAPPDGSVLGLREAAATLLQDEGGLAAHATALLNWHRRHPHCSRCGAETQVAEAGYVRRCPRCGAEHHPRTDPVVIMLVSRGDEVLLGRQPSWPADRYSALAGFVEPGESLEEAVAREVLEESGVTIRAPRYYASQPWPFPGSLMVGFFAEHAAGEPVARDGELEDARWFSRAELERSVAGEGALRLPPRLAIARRLVDHWLAERGR
jgi:NAD+ diphosphatase